jgi:hypothetical protein
MRARLADLERRMCLSVIRPMPCFDNQLSEKTVEDLDGLLLMYVAVGLADSGISVIQ